MRGINLDGASSLRTIPVEALIAPDFRRFTTEQVITDGVLDLYLHRSAGTVQVNGGEYGAQPIETVAPDEAFVAFLRDALARLDGELALDFRLVEDPAQADVRFYLDSEIELGGSGTTLGIALQNDTPGKDFWEVMLNTPAFGSDRNYLYYAALHELGHIALEHPFDNSDGDVFGSSNSSRSAYPEETVMAYRTPESGEWPTWYSANDLAALKAVFGAETEPGSTQVPQRLIGSPSDDVLIGGSANDLLRGEGGNDVLTGGLGADELWGGKGSNRFSSRSDGAEDWLLIQRDGSRQQKRNSRSVDEITELGEEDRLGILGTSTGRLRFRSTELRSREYGRLKGTGIYVGQRLEAIYTGDALSRRELRELSVGLPASYPGELG